MNSDLTKNLIQSQVITSQDLVEQLEEHAPPELDLCDVDRPIKNQQWICISFVEPQFEIMEKRENHCMHSFLQRYLFEYTQDVVKTMANDYGIDEKDALRRYNLIPDPNLDPSQFADQKEWEKMKETQYDQETNNLFSQNIYDTLVAYRRYKEDNVVELRDSLKKEYPDECFDRALKFRGAFSSQTKAKKHATELYKRDKLANIFVVQGFHWVPFNPPQELIRTQKTQDRQLNKLLWGYKKNQVFAERFFEERKEEMLKDKVRKPTNNLRIRNKQNEGLLGPPPTMQIEENENN